MSDAFTAKLFSVAGKTILITGGGGGIGRMLSAAFLAAGARVYITGRKSRVSRQRNVRSAIRRSSNFSWATSRPPPECARSSPPTSPRSPP